MAAWRFRPSLWAVAGFMLGLGVCSSLGMWQLQRGMEKQRLIDASTASANAPAQAFDRRLRSDNRTITHVVVEGRYDPARQFLLDNQSHRQRPGYQVWSPLQLDSGEWLIVNRGWVPLTEQRSQLPALALSESPRQLTGRWQSLPRAGMTQAPAACKKAAQFPLIVNYPSANDLSCLLDGKVLDGQLLLDADQPEGYVRDWSFENGFPPSRHYGYALQWYALALTLLVLFVKLNLKRN